MDKQSTNQQTSSYASMKNFYTPQEYDYAKEVNILRYLQEKGHPFEQEGTSYYRSKEYSSLVIRDNGLWSWNKYDLNGRSPISLLSQIYQEQGQEKQSAYVTAVQDLAAYTGYQNRDRERPSAMVRSNPPEVKEQKEEKQLEMPEKSKDFKRAIAYLCQTRGIDYEIVKQLMSEKKIIQEAKTNNVGFIAYDENKEPRHVFLRGTFSEKSFKKDAPGSDKSYPFIFGGNEECKRVYVFESTIDALSHATLAKRCGQEPKDDYRITLNGVTNEGLDRFLKEHDVKEIVVCTDNDKAGEKCAERIAETYKESYQIFRQIPPEGKDWNEYLVQETVEREVTVQETVELER